MMRRPAGSAPATGRGCGVPLAHQLQRQRRRALLLVAAAAAREMMRWRRARTMTPGRVDPRQGPQQGAPRDRSVIVRASVLVCFRVHHNAAGTLQYKR